MSASPTSDYRLPLVLSVVLVLGMFLGYKLSRSAYHQGRYNVSNRKLDALITLIDEHYVDSINREKLYKNGIEGLLTSLDPHTVYIPKNELEDADDELDGAFYGIGIEYIMYQDTVRVTAILPKGPSVNSGLKTGDRLIKIDDALIAGVNYPIDSIVKKIKGQISTDVNLTVLHTDNKEEKIGIHRGNVPIQTIASSYMMNITIGYIRIRMFSETTYKEFREVLQKMVSKGIKKLLIDVRNNPGGYMDAVAQIADELIPGKELLITTKGRKTTDKVFSEQEGLFEKGTLMVLINEHSASASEILAGITQDLDRGIVAGRRSYGKGLVQEQFYLPDNDAIRITTARYYLPSGRCIQKNYENGKEAYQDELRNRIENIHQNILDTLAQNQKAKTFYTKLKRQVYDNEGITPDHRIPLLPKFTTSEHSIVLQLFASGFYNRNEDYFKKIKSYYDMPNLLAKNETLLREFRHFLKQQNIVLDHTNFLALQNEMWTNLAAIHFQGDGEGYVSSFSDSELIDAFRELSKLPINQ